MKKFVIRVYGILIYDENILLSEETGHGKYFTKLPGGGLEWGEGTIDCLHREFKEELQVEIDVLEHFYTTDFFLPSAFNPNHQIISIYYRVAFKDIHKAKQKIDAQRKKILRPPVDERFVWVPLNELSTELVTYPADKKVIEMLLQNNSS